MVELWQQALAKLKEKLGKQSFDTWIRPTSFVSLNKTELRIAVPSKLHRDWITEHFLAQIEEVIGTLCGQTTAVTFEIDPETVEKQIASERTLRKEDREKPPVQTPHRVNNLSARYTFDSFVVGASNQFAHAASLAVANKPGLHYNPLFIYGGVGLGKTHLVNAIGNQAANHNGQLKVLYLSSESFMNELIGSLRRDKMDEFKTKFRNVDVLILDDVQFIAGKERTQEEFFHTFNSLYDAHKQIVLTSDKFPKEIPGLEDRLRNRFEWGLIADIQPPDVETRIAILQKKAVELNVQLPQEIGIFLASNISSNVRELEGGLTRLSAFSSMTKAALTIDLAKEVLRNILRDARPEVTVEGIQKAICDYYNVKIGELKAKRRTQNIALPRQVAMYLCRKHTDTSFPAIGAKFGGRDHSTVIHASKTIEQRIKDDPQMQITIEKLERTLKK
ncbi:MAG: chromosomal replication initiator protein DnaA [Deltaproteobacteria bacterium]|nr:chromosomal replication initiator protein DnaA [Deltaproteobacteria bacterium]